jgi:hypothetical protein
LRLFATVTASIRNAIVHRFNYDYDIHLPTPWNMPDRPQTAQHFFAAAFVDRIILQLFGLGAHLKPSESACEASAR